MSGSELEALTLRLPKSLNRALDVAVRKGKVSNKTELIRRALSEFLENHPDFNFPRFQHLNVYEDHATVVDNWENSEANIFFRLDQGVAYCDQCEATSCEHITFILGVDDVIGSLKRAGWVRKK